MWDLSSGHYGHGNHLDIFVSHSQSCQRVTIAFLWDIMSLVGGFTPSEKYYIVNWDDYSQYAEKYEMFQTTNQISVRTIPNWMMLVFLWGCFCPLLLTSSHLVGFQQNNAETH